MRPGDHGSTFAGGPLVCHVAQYVVDRVRSPSFLEGAKKAVTLCKCADRTQRSVLEAINSSQVFGLH